MRVRPRLLFIFTQVFADGGIERFNRTLLAACEPLDADCDVLSLCDVDVSNIAQPISATGFAGNKLHFARAVFRALWRRRYALVLVGHINFLVLVYMSLRCRLFHRPRTMLICHGIDAWSGIVGLRRLALRSIDTILCVSQYTQAMMERQAPEIPRARYTIFPNALNVFWTDLVTSSGEPPFTLAARWSLPERFLLSVARLSSFDRTKGIISVIETLPMLDDPDIAYVIAGEGNDRSFLELIAARTGVRDRIYFLGSVSDQELSQLYRRCTLFVLPSGQEGFGIVFLEAMYFNAPVIAAAAKGAVDVVQQEQTGLLVPYGDIVRLKSSLDRLLADQALRDRLRTQARSSVTNGGPFTFCAFMDRWTALVQRHTAC